MVAARWALAGLLMLGFGYATVCNFVGPIRAAMTGKGYSMVPLMGGILCAAGLLVVPANVSPWWWILLFADPGTTLMVWMIPAGIWLNWRNPAK
jgi:hypothetical protein